MRFSPENIAADFRISLADRIPAKVVWHKIRQVINRKTDIGKCQCPFQSVEKVCFFQKKCLFSIPIKTLCGLCVLQSLWAFNFGHPCPFMNALLALRPCLVSHQCRCVLQRLSVADFKRPCLKPLGVQLRASMPLYERSVGFASVPRQPSVSLRPAATKCG